MERVYTERQKQAFKDRLKKIISKKFDTTFIHALAQFETAFGFLWKNGAAIEELNDNELAYREMWEEVRNNILNNGNKQKRNAMTELDMHNIIWKRYVTNFKTVSLTDVDENKEME